ncbi:putative integral membrane protein [Mycolicibacterium chubuense NBB4]|uniref:Putative integral membrane protein n=1 Tax=Mycolicibacterium chubuense (strain NBB4) TaxID=710421 RepID=I4BQF1_MYCCN|nr:anthrone oxygenase family protein [Mycolicibacterium chubuense]AFM19508.1 putative integral membrane protein [Mycolicibacterium chubuense NBB4]
MTDHSLTVLSTVAALASAVAGGMMFVFSTFVMRGLDRVGPLDAISAMRGINAEAESNALFLIVYFGAAVLAVAVGVLAGLRWHTPGSAWLLAGAVCGVVGAIVTVAFNVPLNDRLDAGPVSAPAWNSYLDAWTRWNHVRTVSSLAAAALLTVGAVQRADVAHRVTMAA